VPSAAAPVGARRLSTACSATAARFCRPCTKHSGKSFPTCPPRPLDSTPTTEQVDIAEIGTTIERTSLFLAAIAAQIEYAQVQPGATSVFSDWVRIATPHGYVEVWHVEEVAEHGLAIQTYQVRDGGQLISVGDLGWICEGASVGEAVEVIGGYPDRPWLRQGQSYVTLR